MGRLTSPTSIDKNALKTSKIVVGLRFIQYNGHFCKFMAFELQTSIKRPLSRQNPTSHIQENAIMFFIFFLI